MDSEEASPPPGPPLIDLRHAVISGHGNIFAHTVHVLAPRPTAPTTVATRRRRLSRR
jgi:hypothetical protein